MTAGTGDPVWRSDAEYSRVAVIAALALESRLITATLRPPADTVFVSGPGREQAAIAARRAIAGGARSLVAWGLAGGLDPAAATGTLVIPDVILSDGNSWPVDSEWQQRLLAAVGTRTPVATGALYTSDQVLTSPAAKARLRTSSGAVAVDMESAAVAAVARAEGIPFVAVRAIADAADHALPEGIDRLVTPAGTTAWWQLPAMLASWQRLRLLVRLSGLSGAARRSLKSLLVTLQEASA